MPDDQDRLPSKTGPTAEPKVDEFGLPIRPARTRTYDDEDSNDQPAPSTTSTHVDVTEQKPPDPSVAQEGPSFPNATIPETAAIEDHNTAQSTISTAVPLANPVITEANASVVDPVIHDQAQQAVMVANSDSLTQPAVGASEWSHQAVTAAPAKEKQPQENELEWQEMPAFATHTIYDDWGKIVAREVAELEDEDYAYGNAAAKGYTRVQLDDDVQSATSLDEDTAYLFKPDAGANTLDDDDSRDVLSQMQATKDLLTEGQRIAYVGLVRVSMYQMTKYLEGLDKTRSTKKQLDVAVESMQMWGQKIMVRLYSHMDLDAAEQIMIEQLAEHGVEPADLTTPLMQNARVKNPTKAKEDAPASPNLSDSQTLKSPPLSAPPTPSMPPPYEQETPPDYSVKDPSELPDTKNIDIDLRWTVLCDLFLVLVADSVYDGRSRALLEAVGSALSVDWLEICRFEKRITDALEMQQEADKENWNEEEHTDKRQKMARNRRLVMMGLATVGGGLVIGLSAGLLAPVIGAGLAAGFTTIGVAGTSTFLGGVGGAALITSIGVTTGGTIAVRASNRRTGPVKTFEYRPLHNNKRVNLIVTVAGWMTGKVDDVRLPFSTVNPIMGDIYSVHWEPEMLQSMGQTINILATEALTQGLQQILGSTLLTALMSAMSLPLVLTKLSYLIDNPWSVSMARADMAGLILADSLIERNLGVRPVTLVGFSLGSRVIYACLRELANRGAYDVVQNVYVFGSPVVFKKDDYIKAKSVVAGRFVNGYATNDWILGYLFRATAGGIMRIAGLASVDIPGVENYNVTETVAGHMAYRKAMPKLLKEVGWVVDSEEFSEIEDPDPDNHEKRQRELINEIEEARLALEKKPEKKGFKALFSRNKKNAEKKEWETYDEKIKAGPASELADGSNQGTLFDIDALQHEVAALAAQGIEIKEIKGTLPPMKIDTTANPINGDGLKSPPILRQTKSFSGFSDGARDSSSSINQANGTNRNQQHDYDEFEYTAQNDSEISMTFESPERPRPTFGDRQASSRGSPVLSPTSSQFAIRPALQSSNTMPVSNRSVSNNTPMSYERNAWADDDDDFGKEKELSMTFE
ncbi:DUF726-domain-containing protein [Aureobasidium subglaciale]|nr:DUF726-domain-containing protein [Aureobasidium subglaciale]KAI5222271.1 DUF726-domain-containing protein [Aureobasidium subglaciale]KAI5226341.1 DUF726-domain-containing protein [Aureobasidium subglaciale]KAI5262069.1 DUF726-domain-containing protein [Aureobasidium subglaciale]